MTATHDVDLSTLSGGDLRFAALAFASSYHNGQTYYKGEAFVHHLFDVGAVAEEFGFGSDTFIAAALLHDVVEDTDATQEEITELFGDEIGGLVDSVTDVVGPDGEALPRVERRRLTRAKTKLNRRGVALKLCDRIANWRAGIEQLSYDRDTAIRYLAIYEEEYADFKADLYQEGEYDAPWAELDRLHTVSIDALGLVPA